MPRSRLIKSPTILIEDALRKELKTFYGKEADDKEIESIIQALAQNNIIHMGRVIKNNSHFFNSKIFLGILATFPDDDSAKRFMEWARCRSDHDFSKFNRDIHLIITILQSFVWDLNDGYKKIGKESSLDGNNLYSKIAYVNLMWNLCYYYSLAIHPAHKTKIEKAIKILMLYIHPQDCYLGGRLATYYLEKSFFKDLAAFKNNQFVFTNQRKDFYAVTLPTSILLKHRYILGIPTDEYPIKRMIAYYVAPFMIGLCVSFYLTIIVGTSLIALATISAPLVLGLIGIAIAAVAASEDRVVRDKIGKAYLNIEQDLECEQGYIELKRPIAKQPFELEHYLSPLLKTNKLFSRLFTWSPKTTLKEILWRPLRGERHLVKGSINLFIPPAEVLNAASLRLFLLTLVKSFTTILYGVAEILTTPFALFAFAIQKCAQSFFRASLLQRKLNRARYRYKKAVEQEEPNCLLGARDMNGTLYLQRRLFASAYKLHKQYKLVALLPKTEKNNLPDPQAEKLSWQLVKKLFDNKRSNVSELDEEERKSVVNYAQLFPTTTLHS